jgi:dynein heavy chain 1
MSAQLVYSEMLDKVGPLRAEVSQLEKAAADLITKQSELQQTITDLEKSIGRYKV